MELLKEQKELIIKLVQKTSVILSLYNNLIDYEKNNNISEYQKTILEINKYSSCFNTYIEKINITKEQYPDFINYLNNFGEYILPEIVDDLVYEDGESLIIKRIVNAIRENLISKKEFFYNEKAIMFSTKLLDDTFNYLFNDLHNGMKVKLELENDMKKVFLGYIDELISDEENADIKEQLISAKYKLIYMNPECESYFLQTYLTNEELHLSSKLVANLCKFGNEDYLALKDDFIYDNIDQSLKELFYFTGEEDLDNNDYKLQIVLRLKLILSVLIMDDQKILDSIANAFGEKINNSFLCDEILNVFSLAEEEKGRYRVLSLGL